MGVSELSFNLFWFLKCLEKKKQEFVHISALCVTCQTPKENNLFVSCGCVKVSICLIMFFTTKRKKKKRKIADQPTEDLWTLKHLSIKMYAVSEDVSMLLAALMRLCSEALDSSELKFLK